jgi:subtilisin family serine protease
VPLRLPRLAQAAAVIGLASAPLACFCMSAHADTWRQSEWWLGKLHVIQAWHSIAGAGVTIAVLADGVNANQADLTGQVTAGPDFTGSRRTPGGPDYGIIGTGLASLIAGHGHGGKAADGIYGIAARARILSVRVTLSPGDPLWSNTGLTSRLPDDIAAGIRYAVRHGAGVIALPADPGMPGIARWGAAHAAAGGSAAEQAAVAYALRNNVVLVAPAGDNAQVGDAPNYPAAYKGVVAVGAFDKNFVKAPYSSRQRYVVLTSAGSGVTVATPSGYRTMNSTWAASSIAAGVAALVRSQFPSLTAAEIVRAMTEGTFYKPPGGPLNGSGYGTIDAAKAIAEAATMSPPMAMPAAFGAVPRRLPVAPAVATTGSVITKELVTDVIISAAALAALLVPITWYGSIVRRRERELALAAANRAQRGRPVTGGMFADPLLDYFGPEDAIAAAPIGSRALPGPRYQQRPALTGRSTLTSAFAPRPLAAPPPEPRPAGAAPRSDAWASASYREPGPASYPADAWTTSEQWGGQAGGRFTGERSGRVSGQVPGQQTVRHAPVSGSPPWEPAPPPSGELPWAVYPAPAHGSASGPVGPPTRQAPPESLWGPGPAASSAPPSMFEPDASEGQDGRADARWPESGNRPIYVWNPESSGDGEGIG